MRGPPHAAARDRVRRARLLRRCATQLNDVDEDAGDERPRSVCAGAEVKTQGNGPVGGTDRAGVADECFANGNPDSSSTNFGHIAIPNNASFLALPVSYTLWVYPKVDFSRNYGILQRSGTSGTDGFKFGCLKNTESFRVRVRTNNGATIHDLQTDVDSGEYMECAANDWYFVALILDQDTVGNSVQVQQTYTLRVTRYAVESDGTLGSVVYDYRPGDGRQKRCRPTTATVLDRPYRHVGPQRMVGPHRRRCDLEPRAHLRRVHFSARPVRSADARADGADADADADDVPGRVGGARRHIGTQHELPDPEMVRPLHQCRAHGADSGLDDRRGVDNDDARDVHVWRRSRIRHGGRRGFLVVTVPAYATTSC